MSSRGKGRPAVIYKVDRPDGSPSEFVTGAGFNGILSNTAETLARKFTALRKDKFPTDPSKWTIVLQPSGIRVTLLTPEAAADALRPKTKTPELQTA